MLTALLPLIATILSVTSLVLDGHFGNHNALHMVRQCGLQLIAKLRCGAVLPLFWALCGARAPSHVGPQGG